MEPSGIATTGIQEVLNATILAPGTARGTFRGPRSASLLDYFILSNRMAAAIDKVSVVEASGVKGHVPVALDFKSRVTTLRALHLRRPPAMETERVYGPLPPPPDGSRARRAAEDALRAAREEDPNVQELLDVAYREWADIAEIELADYAASPPKQWGERGRLPNLVWRSVVPENSPRDQYPHAAAAAWICAMAKEVKRIRTEGGRDGTGQVEPHHVIDDDPSTVPHGDEESATTDMEVARARGRKPPTSTVGCIKVLEELLTSIDTDMPGCGSGEAAQEVDMLRSRVRAAAEEQIRSLRARGESRNAGEAMAAAAAATTAAAAAVGGMHGPHDDPGGRW